MRSQLSSNSRGRPGGRLTRKGVDCRGNLVASPKMPNRWPPWNSCSRACGIPCRSSTLPKTLKRHEAGLLSYFAHPITNAGAEGLNSRIQAIRVSARGYRSCEHFKTSIHFHLGGLQLYRLRHDPQTSAKRPNSSAAHDALRRHSLSEAA